MNRMDDDPQSWDLMEAKLKEAACQGNVEFLTKAIASPATCKSYWLSRFVSTRDKEPYAGNILHLAVWHGKTDFVKYAVEKLPEKVVHRLLCHQEPAGELHNRTPALLAIERGDSSSAGSYAGNMLPFPCIKVEEKWTEKSPEKSSMLLCSVPPTPTKQRDPSSAEILTSGHWAELIQEFVDDQENSPLFLAVKKGLDKVVDNLLNCRGPVCGRGPNGLTALHVLPGLLHDNSAPCEPSVGDDKRWHEVLGKLFERLKELTTATDNCGFTILHKWVEMYSSQSNAHTKKRIEELFEYFFKRCKDDAVRLMLVTDHEARNNPLHHMVTVNSTDTVAKQLIDLYKKYTTSKASNLLQNHDEPWLMKNKDGDTPLVLAIRNKHDQVAVHFLSADPVSSLRLSDQQNPFILAVCNQCHQVAKEILAVIAQHYDLMSLLPFDDNPGADVLHFALRFPETFIEEVKEKLSSPMRDNMKLGSSVEYRVFKWASWKPMDAELKRAACSDDVYFLKDKITSESRLYWLSRFIPTEGGAPCAGNILHLAISQGRTEFVKQAIEKLPDEVVHLLLCQQETAGGLLNWNPLHLAVFKKNQTIVEAIADYDNHLLLRKGNNSMPLESLPEVAYKYRAKDSKGRTPALLAIQQGDSCCADILTSKLRAELIQDIVDNEGSSPLFLAVQNGLPKVVSCLLDCDGSLRSSGPLRSGGPDGSTALHVAPGLSDSSVNVDGIYQKLFSRLSNLITKSDNNGFTVLHKWAEMGCKPADNHVTDKGNLQSLLKYFFENHGADAAKLMLATDHKAGNNPLHVLAATSTSTTTTTSTSPEPMAGKIATQLIGLFKNYLASNSSQNHDWPWLMKNKNEDTPLLLALRYKLEDLALCLLQYYPENSLVAFRDGSNILHSASASDYPEKVIKKVVNKFPSLITQRDETPLDKASEAGKLWLVKLMVKKDPESLSKARHAWQRACENGHLDVIKSFIKHCPTFRGICLASRDTPLHHITLSKGSYAQYREFLEHKVIAEMINARDDDKRTPLHKAISNQDVDLTEALFAMDDINFHIMDQKGKTAMDLLAEECKRNKDWVEMCERAEIDPTLKTAYVQHRKYLLKTRETLLVVAALFATITFQAGFTLPGGLNDDSGDAILAKKAAFLAFLLADTYAMCCSILVLFCLLWSIFCDGNKSMTLIDCSMSILLHSLYASLVAFMTGVYIVVSHKSMWAAITTIVMCSLIGISAISENILHWLLSKAKKGYSKLLEGLGKAFTLTKKGAGTGSTGEAVTSTNQSFETNSKEEAPTSTSESSGGNSQGRSIDIKE